MAFARPCGLLLLLALAPANARAQSASAREAVLRYDAPAALPGWKGEVALIAGNALIGGLATAIANEIRGGSFRQGFTAGAAGSVVAYGGRRLSVAEFSGAGFLGRELNAIGASMVRNAGAGRPALERIVLPIGPGRFYIDRSGQSTAVRFKLSLHELYWTTSAALDTALSFRAAASLSTGAPVFQKRLGRLQVGGQDVNGYQVGGTVFLSGEGGLGQAWTLAHETVHVLQGDFTAIAWLDSVEGRLMRHTAATRAIHRYFDPGILETTLRTSLSRGLGFGRVNAAPEFEAELLEHR